MKENIMSDNKKVLVVDDEKQIVHVVAIKLRNNGYEVISAKNGAEALELVLESKPDIVLTDSHMPVMSGMELIEKLRQNEDTKGIPVIMLTERGFAVPQEQQDELQITGCLSKPFSPKELLQNIENILYSEEQGWMIG